MAFVGRCLALKDHVVLCAYERPGFCFLLLLSPFGPHSFVYTSIIYKELVSRGGDDHFIISSSNTIRPSRPNSIGRDLLLAP